MERAANNTNDHRSNGRIARSRKYLLSSIAILGLSCTDYQIISSNPVEPEIVYVYSEVPTYIEQEVPTDDYTGQVWVDSFEQPFSVNGVDILWVIDTSGSMNRYDANLMLGIETMLNALPPSGWRLAMTSNDPLKASSEAQFPLVPGDDILDAEAMYSAMGRGGREEGFDATYEYINNPYASTWMRPDAALLVVFVSDEEDQSDDHFPAVSDFISWYSMQRAGSAFLSSIVNVAAVDSVCTWAVNPIDIGDRYMDATSFLGGVVVDICSEDWAPGVTDASAQIDPHEEWDLTHKPIESSIRLFIDTVARPNSEWIYDPVTNTIEFLIIPPGGSLVEIGYIIDEDASDTGS